MQTAARPARPPRAAGPRRIARRPPRSAAARRRPGGATSRSTPGGLAQRNMPGRKLCQRGPRDGGSLSMPPAEGRVLEALPLDARRWPTTAGSTPSGAAAAAAAHGADSAPSGVRRSRAVAGRQAASRTPQRIGWTDIGTPVRDRARTARHYSAGSGRRRCGPGPATVAAALADNRGMPAHAASTCDATRAAPGAIRRCG